VSITVVRARLEAEIDRLTAENKALQEALKIRINGGGCTHCPGGDTIAEDIYVGVDIEPHEEHCPNHATEKGMRE